MPSVTATLATSGSQRVLTGHRDGTLRALMQMPHIHLAGMAAVIRHSFRDGGILSLMQIMRVNVAAEEETTGVKVVNDSPVAHENKGFEMAAFEKSGGFLFNRNKLLIRM